MTANQTSEEESIRQKLADEGLDSTCSDAEKVIHLWHIYVKTESHLKASLGTVNELQEQQAEEMKEFENYVEHVKNLSKEREALTVEFAAENDGLKAENDQLRQELESYKNDETRDMLLQQGLDDIAHGTASEQIAYLLVERARLMDELDAAEESAADTSEGPMTTAQMVKLLEQERTEFEAELRQQRESMNRTREDLKAGHEEEVAMLMEENEHLQELLDKTKAKLTNNNTSEDFNQTPSKESLRNDDRIAEIEAKNQEEILVWKRKVRELEQENVIVTNEVERLKSDLQREKSRVKDQLSDYEEDSKQELESLRQDKQKLGEELEETKLQLRQEKQNAVDFELKVKRSEATLKVTQSDFDKIEDDLNNKIKSLESQVLNLEESLSQSRREVHNANADAQKEIQASLSVTETQLKESENKLRDVKAQKDVVEQELGREREQNMVLQTQVEVTTGQVSRLTEAKEQLEKDNEELSKKLTDAKKECVQKERDLMDERDKLHGRHQDSDERLSRAHSDMDQLQQEVTKLTADLHRRQEKIDQLELKLDSEKTQAQSSLASLRREIEGLQRSHEAETETLTQSLEKAQAENSKLRLTNTEKQKEIERLREDISRVRVNEVGLNSSAAESDMAWMNKHDKDVAQMKLQQDLYKKSAMLETSAENMQMELDKKTMEISGLRAELAQLKGEHNGEALIAQTSADTYKKKSETELEKKLFELQDELTEARRRLNGTEKDASEATLLRTELRIKTDEIIQLKNQLQDEKFKKISGGFTSEEANQQIQLFRQREADLQKRNNELQHMLLDVESRLEAVKTQTRSNADVRRESEHSKQSLQEQFTLLELEADGLRVELLKVTDKYDKQLHKYSERKNRTKVQLQKARDYYNSEKAKLRAEVERLDRDLKLTKAVLAKEMEWKDSVDDRHHALLQENRTLMMQLTEQGETVRDTNRQLSVLQVRCKFLEEENNTLQQRVDSLVRQKQNLDRIIKEYQFERHKEELQKIFTLNTAVMVSPRSFVASLDTDRTQTSGLGDSSLTSTLDKGHSLDAIISPRANTAKRNIKFNQTVTAGVGDDTEDDVTFEIGTS